MVKRFQKFSFSVSLRSTLTWCVDILFEKSKPETRGEFEKHHLRYVSGGEDFMQSLFSFLISLLVIHTMP